MKFDSCESSRSHSVSFLFIFPFFFSSFRGTTRRNNINLVNCCRWASEIDCGLQISFGETGNWKLAELIAASGEERGWSGVICARKSSRLARVPFNAILRSNRGTRATQPTSAAIFPPLAPPIPSPDHLFRWKGWEEKCVGRKNVCLTGKFNLRDRARELEQTNYSVT